MLDLSTYKLKRSLSKLWSSHKSRGKEEEGWRHTVKKIPSKGIF